MQTGLKIYNNYFSGVGSKKPDSLTTAIIFIDQYELVNAPGAIIVNNFCNVSTLDTGYNNGVWGIGAGQVLANNTCISPSTGGGNQIFSNSHPSNVAANNIQIGPGLYDSFQSASSTPYTNIINYNMYYLGTPSYYAAATPGPCGPGIGSFAQFHSLCGFEANGSSAVNPLINSDGTLMDMSPAIEFGLNLTALGIDELATGAPQTFGRYGSCGTGCQPRSSDLMVMWDAGAYPVPSESAPVVSLSTTAHDFGSQAVNTSSAPFLITLTNTGSATLTITTVALTTHTQYALSSNTCASSMVVAAGTCTLLVTFTPTTTGSKLDTITFTDDASDSPQTIALSGTGTTFSPNPSTTGGISTIGGGTVIH